MISLLVVVAVAHAAIPVQVLKTETGVDRYIKLDVGAYPGTSVPFLLTFESNRTNKLPIQYLDYSTTYTVLNTTFVRDAVYYKKQKNMAILEFELTSGTTGEINLDATRYPFCYTSIFQNVELELNDDCNVYHTHNVYSRVYSTSNGLLDGHPFSATMSNRSCNTFDFETEFDQCNLTNIDDDNYILEYRDGTLRVYKYVDKEDEVTLIALVFILIAFMSIWLNWTKNIHLLLEQHISLAPQFEPPNTANFIKMLTKSANFYTLMEEIQDNLAELGDQLYPFSVPPVKKHVEFDEKFVKIAAQNRIIWDDISKYSILVIDMAALVASTTIISTLQHQPSLYREEIIELTSEPFVENYLYYWGYFVTPIWTIFIIMLVSYSFITTVEFVEKNEAMLHYGWFSFGNAWLSSISLFSRIIVLLFLIAIFDVLSYVFWVMFAGATDIGYVFIGVIPIIIASFSNMHIVQRLISPHLAKFYIYDTVLCIAMRWSVEAMILSNIHALTPLGINGRMLTNFSNGLALVLGSTISIITGRDITLIAHIIPYSKMKTMTVFFVIVGLLTLSVGVLMHSTLFLTGSMFVNTVALGSHSVEALYCTVSFSIQLFAIGSMWASHKIQIWRATAVKQA